MEEMAGAAPAHLLARGAYDAPREDVPRDTPSALPPSIPSCRATVSASRVAHQPAESARRARGRQSDLADALRPRARRCRRRTSAVRDALPSHPELLDWLAARFMESGWDVKALHRLIVTSATFQQSSRATPEHCAKDPDNRLLSRGPTTRLSAEEIRDSALAASGLLTRTIGGPSVKPYQPAGLWEQSGTGKTYTQDHGAQAVSPQPVHVLAPHVAAAVDADLRRRCRAKSARPSAR